MEGAVIQQRLEGKAMVVAVEEHSNSHICSCISYLKAKFSLSEQDRSYLMALLDKRAFLEANGSGNIQL